MNPQIGEIVAEMQDLLDSGDPAKFRYIREWKDKLEALGGWQDISTAPKDGSRVLLYGFDGYEGMFGVWNGQWVWAGYLSNRLQPTHWQPLPPPPGERHE